MYGMLHINFFFYFKWSCMLVILNINSLGRNIEVYVDDMLVKNLVKLALKSSFEFYDQSS